MTRLVWLRSDLRSLDNPALWHAFQDDADSVIAVSFICEQQWRQHGSGERQIQLIKNALSDLQQQLKTLNIPLLIISSSDFSDSQKQLQQLCLQQQVSDLFFNIEYELNETQRDKQLTDWCQQQLINVHSYHDQCVIPPGKVLTRQGTMAKVYSPFKRAWQQCYIDHCQPPLPAPVPRVASNMASVSAGPGITIKPITIEPQPDLLWSTDEYNAHQQLQQFLDERVADYHLWRDFPAQAATSGLSFALKIGLLSNRQCLYTAWQQNACVLAGGEPGLDSWINELIWREFYRHLLVAFPQLNKHKAFKADTETVPWRHSKKDFDAWCQGNTGYPLVDAAQRQLLQTGWMHNRLRMVSAMFLTKHLLIDWRWGEAWFARHLVDFDLASNNGGWQWSASTGADGAPYFRIFNPISQSQKFDPEGEFIARYVPELASLPPKSRHQPNQQQRRHCHYADEIVEHKFARKRALSAFKGEPLLHRGEDHQQHAIPPEQTTTDLFSNESVR